MQRELNYATWCVILTIALGPPLSFGETKPATHRVRKGDTLSNLALSHLSSPVYGKVGSLHKVVQVNPQIPNPDLIYPGQIVYLPWSIEVPDEKEKAKRKKEPPKVTQVDVEEKIPETQPEPQEEPKVKTPWDFQFLLSYRPSAVFYDQKGSFGQGTGKDFALLALGTEFGVRHGNWNAAIGYDAYRLSMITDAFDARARVQRRIRKVSLLTGYKDYFIGAHSKTFPVMKNLGSGKGSWSDFELYSVFIGMRYKRPLAMSAWNFYAEPRLSIPVAAGGSPFSKTGRTTGFGLSVISGLERSIFGSQFWGFHGFLLHEQDRTPVTWSRTGGVIERTLKEFGIGIDYGIRF